MGDNINGTQRRTNRNAEHSYFRASPMPAAAVLQNAVPSRRVPRSGRNGYGSAGVTSVRLSGETLLLLGFFRWEAQRQTGGQMSKRRDVIPPGLPENPAALTTITTQRREIFELAAFRLDSARPECFDVSMFPCIGTKLCCAQEQLLPLADGKY